MRNLDHEQRSKSAAFLRLVYREAKRNTTTTHFFGSPIVTHTHTPIFLSSGKGNEQRHTYQTTVGKQGLLAKIACYKVTHGILTCPRLVLVYLVLAQIAVPRSFARRNLLKALAEQRYRDGYKVLIQLMDQTIRHHLKWRELYKYWAEPPTNWGEADFDRIMKYNAS